MSWGEFGDDDGFGIGWQMRGEWIMGLWLMEVSENLGNTGISDWMGGGLIILGMPGLRLDAGHFDVC